jgi:hypothetical protein
MVTMVWLGYVNRMDRTRVLRRTLQLKFKGKRQWYDPEQDGSAMY